MAAALLLLAGCAGMEDLVQKPTARIDSVAIAKLNFEQAELLVNVEIDNPNPLGFSLSAYDYGIDAWDSTVASGRQEKGMTLQPAGSSLVPIPVTIQFTDILNLGQSALHAESVPLGIKLGLEIAVPYMPVFRLDLKSKTELPVPRPPRILPKSIKVKNISLTGADIAMNFDVSNPNTFALDINSLSGLLEVSGNEWGEIGISRPVYLADKGKQNIEAGMHLDFISLGRSAWQLLSGSGKADVKMTGNMDVDMNIPGFQGQGIPWNAGADISIVR